MAEVSQRAPDASGNDRPVIGVDLGGTLIRAALSNRRGEIVDRREIRTLADEGVSAVLDRIIGLVEALHEQSPGVSAVGIGCPGPLDSRSGVVYSPPAFPGWHDVPLARMVQERTGILSSVGNDANVAALGEFEYGAGRGVRHLVYITVSTGVGGGVIVDGLLLEGRRGFAGEIGHTILEPEGPLCGCGGRGHVEALASGTAIARQAREALDGGRESIIGEIAGDEGVTARTVAEAAERGDELGRELIRIAGHWLGYAMINMVHLFNPQVIVIGGGVSQSGELLLEPMRETLFDGLMPVFGEDLRIVPPGLGVDAGLYGAVALARRTAGAS